MCVCVCRDQRKELLLAVGGAGVRLMEAMLRRHGGVSAALAVFFFAGFFTVLV